MASHFRNIVLFLFLAVTAIKGFAQISPGALSKAHSHLEGISNCTKCHVLGEKETSSKCLECHKEIKNLISAKKGYHASTDVQGNKCANCHGEHFGLDFEVIRFDESGFDHALAGYKLEGKHAGLKCAECHNPELIRTKISQKKGNSYLGLGTECLSCHDDFHRNTLSGNCTACHNQNAFRPAPNFNHSKTKFPLAGKHQNASCEKCHKMETIEGRKFQRFAGIPFSNCTSCHEDVHQNKFGSDCRKCHTEFSFREVKSLSGFNHDKTNFPLKGKHVGVDCKKCHKSSYTQRLAFKKCTGCHSDYHEKQLVKNGSSPDCSECHSVEGFSPSSFGIEKHNLTKFKLEGSHLATPCFECHRKTEKWNFRMDNKCTACHKNIHETYISKKFIPEDNCALCHSTGLWGDIDFDHKKTRFELEGKHKQAACRDCHFRKNEKNEAVQQFFWENQVCTNCHPDVHCEQFNKDGSTRCETCHTNNNWKPEKFDHNTARFKLDGKHEGLACARCHKPGDDKTKKYIIYKFEDISCKSCH